VPLRKLLAKAWTSSLVANKSPSVPPKISWEEVRWGGGFRNTVVCDYRHSLRIHGVGVGSTGAAWESRLFSWGAFDQQCSQTDTSLMAKGLLVFCKRKKTIWGISFPKEHGFCFGGAFYI